MTRSIKNPHNYVSERFAPKVIAIIGGMGSMGRRLAEEFKRDGYEVRLTGEAPLREIGPTDSKEWKRALSRWNRSICKGADVVVFSVPIPLLANGNGLEEIFGRTPARGWRDKLVIDICSTKSGPVRAMAPLKGATVIGTHPMFGPKVQTLEGQTVFVCPVRHEADQHILNARLRVRLSWLKSFWEQRGVTVVEISPEEHDAFMPSVQFSVLLSVLLYGDGLRQSGVSLDRVQLHGTPNSRTLCSRLARMISAQMLPTYVNLAFDNSLNLEWLDRAAETLATIRRALNSRNREHLRAFISRLVEWQSEDFRANYSDLSVFLDECAAKRAFLTGCLARESQVRELLARPVVREESHPPKGRKM